MKKLLLISAAAAIVAAICVTGFVGWSLYPHKNLLPVGPPLAPACCKVGKDRLRDAEATADYDALSAAFEPQIAVSFCGVASSVTVLGALGIETSQMSFFDDDAGRVRSRFRVLFGGMSLEQLAGLLAAHGVDTSIRYAEDFDVGEFRAVAERNLSTSGDYLLVNYDRAVLGQTGGGHISPVAAYDRDTDSVLVMDTAAHKYPSTWVPIDMLHEGMRAIVSSTGRARGYVEVSR